MLLPCLPENADILSDMYEKVPQAAGISTYLAKNALYPVYQNTDVTYYDQASKGLEAQLSDLSKARKFIFMEYHAIEDKESWHRIQKVLTERVQAGVEVRVFYVADQVRYIYAPARAVTVTLASDVSFSFLQEDQTAATAVKAATLFLL